MLAMIDGLLDDELLPFLDLEDLIVLDGELILFFDNKSKRFE